MKTDEYTVDDFDSVLSFFKEKNKEFRGMNPDDLTRIANKEDDGFYQCGLAMITPGFARHMLKELDDYLRDSIK